MQTLNINIITNKDYAKLMAEANKFCDRVEAVSVQMMAPDKVRNYSTGSDQSAPESYLFSVMIVFKKNVKDNSGFKPVAGQHRNHNYHDDDTPF